MIEEFSPDPDLSPQQNEAIRKLYDKGFSIHPNIWTSTPTATDLQERQIAVYDDATDQRLYIKIDGTVRNFPNSSQITTEIAAAIATIDDLWETSGGSAQLKTGDTVNFQDEQALNFIVENRTDDTGMTVTGQLWFRTDV